MADTVNKFKNRVAGLLAMAILAIGFAPGVAAAQSGPSADQYNPPPTIYRDQTDGGLDTSVGGLPFTGFDVIAMLAVALTVTGLGLALQRAVSREPRDLQ